MSLRLILLAYIIFMTNLASGQDAVFMHPWVMPVRMNPAFAGTGKCFYGAGARVNLPVQYDAKWNLLSYGASWDLLVPSIGGGLAIQVMNTNIRNGSFGLQSIKGAYNYFLPLFRSKTSLHLAIAPGWERNFYHPGPQFTPDEDLRPLYNLPDIGGTKKLSTNYVTFDAGIAFCRYNHYGKNSGLPYFGYGISVLGFNRPSWSLIDSISSRKNPLVTLHGEHSILRNRARFDVDKKELALKGFYRWQGEYTDWLGGAQGRFGYVNVGLFYHGNHFQKMNAKKIQGLLMYDKFRLVATYTAEYAFNNQAKNIRWSHGITLLYFYCIPPGIKPFMPLIMPEF